MQEALYLQFLHQIRNQWGEKKKHFRGIHHYKASCKLGHLDFITTLMIDLLALEMIITEQGVWSEAIHGKIYGHIEKFANPAVPHPTCVKLFETTTCSFFHICFPFISTVHIVIYGNSCLHVNLFLYKSLQPREICWAEVI